MLFALVLLLLTIGCIAIILARGARGGPHPDGLLGLVRALAARWLDLRRGGISTAHALLLIPVVGLVMLLLGPGHWFGLQAFDGLDTAVADLGLATAALVLIFRSRAWAATLAAAGLLVLGASLLRDAELSHGR